MVAKINIYTTTNSRKMSKIGKIYLQEKYTQLHLCIIFTFKKVQK